MNVKTARRRASRLLLFGGILIGLVSAGAPSAAAAQSLRWSVTRTPNRGASDNLDAVSCLSKASCVAVGSAENSRGFAKTLIETWNGTAWSVVPSPNAGPGFSINALGGVSCVSAAFCVTVGGADNTLGVTRTLIELRRGTKWSVVPSPDRGTRDAANVLNAVSCVSPAACTAVGQFSSPDPNEAAKTLVESWNGSTWSVVPSPNRGPASSPSDLTGVSCASASRCFAVGLYFNVSGQERTLIESWNGTRWLAVPSPNAGPLGNPNDLNELEGVTCSAASRCVAVGSFSNAQTVSRTLVESWNGTAWSIVPSPNPGSLSTPSALVGVSCVSARDCVAVGSTGSGRGGASRTLIESWNGTAWSVVPSPDAGSASDFDSLRGVSCASARFCMGIGRFSNINGVSKTLAETGTAPAL